MRNLLLALCSLVLALGLVEVVLRSTHAFGARVSWTQPDPWIGWRFTPGREYWFFGENDHAITGRINALGWRDRERARVKRAETVRIAVVGDSYVEAFQVELDSTFVAVAERSANAREGRTSEFLNFGRSGMGLVEERVLLERDVLASDPDVVVLLFTPGNDIAAINPLTAETLLRPFCSFDDRDSLVVDTSFRRSRAYRVRTLLNPFKQRSALVSLVADRYNAWRGAGATAPGIGPGERVQLTPEQSLMTSRPDSTYLANYQLAKRIMVDASRACASRGVSFVLLSVPLVYEGAEIAALRALDGSFDPGYFDRDLGALADSAGIAFVPLTEDFSGRARTTGERLHWAHWNYPGHRVVGEVLAEAIVASRQPSLPDH